MINRIRILQLYIKAVVKHLTIAQKEKGKTVKNNYSYFNLVTNS